MYLKQSGFYPHALLKRFDLLWHQDLLKQSNLPRWIGKGSCGAGFQLWLALCQSQPASSKMNEIFREPSVELYRKHIVTKTTFSVP